MRGDCGRSAGVHVRVGDEARIPFQVVRSHSEVVPHRPVTEFEVTVHSMVMTVPLGVR